MLEANGILVFSEGVFNPTKLKFTIGNTELYNFQIKNEKHASLISLLSRSYPGIFQMFFEINEIEFCKRLKITQKELENQFKFLEQMGVMDVAWKSSEPTVTFAAERNPGDHLYLATEKYFDRKEKAFKRLDSLLDYLKDPICRNIQLLNYFSQKGEKCGTCDICQLEKQMLSKIDARKKILSELQEPHDLLELQRKTEINLDDLTSYLQECILEEIVREEKGIYQVQKIPRN